MSGEPLQCKDLTELQAFPEDIRRKFLKEDCGYVFRSMENLYAKAKCETNIESRYKLFYRCATLSEIISGKNGFKEFDKRKTLFAIVSIVLEELERLTPELEEKYKQRQENTKLAPNPKNNVLPIQPVPESVVKVTPESKVWFSPKDLVRKIEREKLSAVIIDFRANRLEEISYQKGPCIQVITVPNDAIMPGLIFNSLASCVNISQRALLHSMDQLDVIVLIGESADPAEKSDDLPAVGSSARILFEALTTYNHQCRLKKDPLFLRGGFAEWRDQYPVYTKKVEGAADVPSRDTLDEMIRKYTKNNALKDVYYPEVSPVKAKPPPAVPRDEISAKRVISPPKPAIAHDTEKPLPPIVTFPSQPQIPTPSASPSISSDVTTATEFTARDVSSAEAIVPRPMPVAPNNEPPRPPLNPVFVPPSHPKPPSFDRSSKPPLSLSTIDANAHQPSAAIPVLDRSQKPMSLNVDLQSQLLGMYDQMLANVSANCSRGPSSVLGCGLYNMGNTCFMNATLQALLQTPELTNVFTRENFLSKVNPTNSMGTRGVISAVFSALCDEVLSGEYSAIRPRKFLEVFARLVNSGLADGHQHDASEFQLFLLDSLHEDTNQVQKKVPFEQNYKGENVALDAADYTSKSLQFSWSPISAIFNLQTVSQLSCTRCGQCSVTFEESAFVSLGLPSMSSKTTLDACFDGHFADADLDDDCRWNCPQCKNRERAKRTTKLWSLPPVLVIQLKRFSVCNGDFEKNQMAVHFPNTLYLSKHVHPQSKCADRGYSLYAVTNHRGRLNSGHYTSIAKHSRSNRWLNFDDESVRELGSVSPDASAAYMLYYRRQ